MNVWLLVLGLVAGATLGATAYWWWQWHRIRKVGPEVLPADVPHVVDLLRRAHQAVAACLVIPDSSPVISLGHPRPPETLIDRAVATANLALADSREHVLREGNVIVAVGDGQLGSAVVLAFGDVPPGNVRAVASDLRRLLAELRVSRLREFGALSDPRAIPDWIAAGAESLEAVAFALCEAIRAQTGRATAVVVRDLAQPQYQIIGVSHTADRRLLGTTVTPDCAVGRACTGDIPVVGTSSTELFGHSRPERRRRAERGIAFPLRDGGESVGALVVFGPHETLKPAVRERILWMAVDAGPRLAMAAQVRVAETQAMTDELTRLPNRRALDRALGAWKEGPGALLCIDIDLFKQVNDAFGHAAGDAALKHIARIFRRALRDDDVAARIGGEEFAIWLPHTPLAQAVEVAERLRLAVESSVLSWGGADLKMTCSLGVSAVPESVTRVENLLPTADSALYQAKLRGRNRVEAARPPGSPEHHSSP